MSGTASEGAEGAANTPADTRATEDLDTRDPFNAAGLQKAGDMTEAQLAAMSEQDIERMLGHVTFDRSTEARPEGDAPLHDMNRAAAAKAAEPAPAAAAAAAEPAAAAAPAVPATPAAPAAPASAPAAAAAATEGDEAPFVETRDGKGRISYSVLQAARKQSQTLREQLEAVNEENARLRAGQPAAAATEVTTTDAQPETAEGEVRLYTAEEVEGLKKSYPDEVVEMLVSSNRTAVLAYNSAQELRADIAARDNTAIVNNVQDFIDQNPLASKWFNADETDAASLALADEATQTDEMLKTHPVWSQKSAIERMTEAIRRTAIANDVEIPGAAPAATTTTVSLREKANAALAAAAKTPQVPITHSDLPGGGAPAQSEREELSGISTTQLEAKMERMTPAQLADYMLKAG